MKIALAAEGGFFEDRALGVELRWPRGGGERMTADIPAAAANGNAKVKDALRRGQIVVLDGPKSPKPKAAGARRKSRAKKA